MNKNNKPDFAKYIDGLVPAIIQDAISGLVLMLGYMSEAAWTQTITTGVVTFYSRSKARLWTKGESSGNYLYLAGIALDCDKDALLVKVQPKGPVCHTGAHSCFGEENKPELFLHELETTIAARKKSGTNDSYTVQLFEKGIAKIAQKVGEEAVELVIEAMGRDENLFKNEAADLLFHYLILLQAKGFSFRDVDDILRQRQRK